MKRWYRWLLIYTFLLGVAFFATIKPSSAFTLLANSEAVETLQQVATTVFSNTVNVSSQFRYQPIAPLQSARDMASSVLLPDGKVLVAGGYQRSPGSGISPNLTAEIYDPATDQWVYTGNMNQGGGKMFVLSSGKVIAVGGRTVEIYDPVTNTWNTGATMTASPGRRLLGRELLLDGRVLAFGSIEAYDRYAEIYDPIADTWTQTGDSVSQIEYFSSILLPNGKVLALSSHDTKTQLYDPLAGTWSAGTPSNYLRFAPKLAILPDGKVIAIGGGDTGTESDEIYDPTLDSWALTGTTPPRDEGPDFSGEFIAVLEDDYILLFHRDRYWLYDIAAKTWTNRLSMGGTARTLQYRSIVQLSPTQVFFAGGAIPDASATSVGDAGIGTFLPANQFTGELTLPSEWILGEATVKIIASASEAEVVAVALSKPNQTPTDWIPASNGVAITTTWLPDTSGVTEVVLHVRDSNGLEREVVRGEVRVDRIAPTSAMFNQGNSTIPGTQYRPANFTVGWSGSDAHSGVATFDVQVKLASASTWQDLLTATTLTQIDYIGENEQRYRFRVRAKDVAGNVEAWSDSYDLQVHVDDEAPIGNMNVASVGATSVLLLIDATDNLSGVTHMRVALADDFADAEWENYNTTKTISFGGPSPSAFIVYVQFRDAVGNVSSVQCASHGPPACYRVILPLINQNTH